MKCRFILFILFCINTGIFANPKRTLDDITKDCMINKFLNASFIFANGNANLIMRAKGIKSLHGELLTVNQKMPVSELW